MVTCSLKSVADEGSGATSRRDQNFAVILLRKLKETMKLGERL